MNLRRTAMKRKTQLKRTPMKRTTALRARQVKASARRRDTGPTVETRDRVAARANGCCEHCGLLLLRADGTWTGDHSIHHRQPRGMGGTSVTAANSPANLLLLCGSGTTGCHGLIERYRARAEADGWIVRHGTDPAAVPVLVWLRGVKRVLLTHDGHYAEAAAA